MELWSLLLGVLNWVNNARPVFRSSCHWFNNVSSAHDLDVCGSQHDQSPSESSICLWRTHEGKSQQRWWHRVKKWAKWGRTIRTSTGAAQATLIRGSSPAQVCVPVCVCAVATEPWEFTFWGLFLYIFVAGSTFMGRVDLLGDSVVVWGGGGSGAYTFGRIQRRITFSHFWPKHNKSAPLLREKSSSQTKTQQEQGRARDSNNNSSNESPVHPWSLMWTCDTPRHGLHNTPKSKQTSIKQSEFVNKRFCVSTGVSRNLWRRGLQMSPAQQHLPAMLDESSTLNIVEAQLGRLFTGIHLTVNYCLGPCALKCENSVSRAPQQSKALC